MTTAPRGLAGPAAALGPARPEADRFAEILRPRVMGPRLADALGGRVRTCHVLDAKYEPGVRATVLYEHDGAWVRGDLVAEGDVGVGRALVVAPGLRISVFPEDPDLPRLPRVMDPAHLGPALADALRGTALPDAPHGVRCRTAPIRYRPGRRVTLRVDLVGAAGAAGAYVAKVYHDARKAAAVVAEAPALAEHAGTCDVLRIPATVAHLPADGVVVQAAVAGRPLEALLGRSLATPGGVAAATEATVRTARALADLHRMPPDTGRARSADAEVERFAHRALGVAGADPRTGAALVRLADRLRTAREQVPGAVPGTVHGDFKPSQVLLGRRHVLLMDLDHLAVADQAMDVGTFLASLRQLPLRSSGADPCRLGEVLPVLRAAFLASYLEARGCEVSPARIGWQEAVALERKALRAWARAPGSPVALVLAGEAEACLDGLTETP
ncbi:phosphotransferase [Nocardioides panacis]|uniref:Phosphotransferase n=1 Tax=Nocardioides panacis TaxID=2849501 RepID=A0A975Y023_9ACTN|nr:phosphotransferase [Nocardioides panacis]QWZ08031.1 phosphotransferase [Nocardioides panacis]